MIEMLMQSMGVTQDDIDNIKTMVRHINSQQERFDSIESALDDMQVTLDEIQSKL